MPDIQAMCNAARLRLDDPLVNQPSYRRILQAVIDSCQNFYSKIENTGQDWSLKPDYLLTVTPNTSDILLAVDNSYGKPLQVLSYWPQLPSYIPRQIEFRMVTSMNYDWPWPANIGSWLWTDGSPNIASRMAFYYKDDGSLWVRVLPTHMQTGSYLVTFASGDWAANVGLEQSPVLSQFHALVEIWAAMSVLASAQWWTGLAGEKENRIKRRELAATLDIDRRRMEDEFDIYRRDVTGEVMQHRIGSFDGESNWGGNW